MNPDVRIYVATHKPYNKMLKIINKNSIYIPIHCGKAIYQKDFNNKKYLPELGDDTGDNISEQNPHYCELTALYWIWKNDNSKPDDIVGLNHYRRYFRDLDCEREPISKKNIIKKLKDTDFLVNGSEVIFSKPNKKEKNFKESIYTLYKNCHIIEDLDYTLEGIKIIFPNLYDTIDYELKNKDTMCFCNLMICRKKHLDEYCNFLFPVLEYANSKIKYNDDKHDTYNNRALGFISERLQRPWLIATGHEAKSLNTLDWK